MSAEVYIADTATESGVATNFYQQMLFRACSVVGAMGLGAHVVSQSAGIEDVIPSADLEHRYLYLGKVFFNRPLFPVFVIVRVGEPVQVIRSDGSRELLVSRELAEIEYRKVGEGKSWRSDKCICIFMNIALEGVRRELRGQVRIEPLFA